MKKTVVLLICFALMITCAFAADSDFVIEGGILKSYTGKDVDIVVPSGVVYVGYSESNASYSAIKNSSVFANKTKIKSITFPESVKYIGWNVLEGATKLETVTFDGAVTNIGSSAFAGCSALKSIDISRVKTLGDGVFYNCESLVQIKAAENTTKTSWYTSNGIFDGCTKLVSVQMIDEIVEDVKNGMFLKDLMSTPWGTSQEQIIVNNCLLKHTTLENNVIIPNAIKNIGHNALDNCPNLTYLSIPKTVLHIYVDKSKLKNCTIVTLKDSAAEQYAIKNGLSVSITDNISGFEPGMSNFSKKQNYRNQFTDVKSTAWYNEYVQKCYEIGLVSGKSDNYFGANDNISISEVITIAARIHSIYNGCDIDLTRADSEAWYVPFVKYAKDNGIAYDFDYYKRPAMRKEIVYILANSLPEKEWETMNNISSLPDVNYTDNIPTAQKSAIFKLYNSGILAGNDEYGTFYPGVAVTRAEVSTIVSKITDKSLRTKISLVNKDIIRNDTTNKIDLNEALPRDLNIQDVMALNGNKSPVYELKAEGTLAYLSGRFSSETVNNVGEAIESLNNIRGLLKITDAREQFVFVKMEDSTTYKLQKAVKGKGIADSYIWVAVNKDKYPVYVMNKMK